MTSTPRAAQLNALPPLTDPDQIAYLPWMGNWADDYPLMQIVDRYIATLTDPAQQQRALFLVDLHMVGEATPPASPEELADIMADLRSRYSH